MNTDLLNRAIENAGPLGDAQRRAMWAKRGNPAGTARAAPAGPAGSGATCSPQPHGADATGERDQRRELAGAGVPADYRWCVLTD